MNLFKTSLVVLSFLINQALVAQVADSTLENKLTKDFEGFHKDIAQKFQLMHNPEEYWEVLGDNIHTQLEAGGNYNTPDEYVNSLWGGSFLWNKYSINGFPINSNVRTGSILHKPKLFAKSMWMDDQSFETSFKDYEIKEDFISLKTTTGGLGGRFPGANTFVNSVIGHSSAQDRQIKPFDYRREMPLLNSLYFIKNFEDSNRVGRLIISADKGKRNHTHFNNHGLAGNFSENFGTLFTQMDFKTPELSWLDKIYWISSTKSRDKLFAEYNYSENETGKEFVLSNSIFGSYKSDLKEFTLGFNYSFRRNEMNKKVIKRNLIDLDGESFEPYHPNADYHDFQLITKGHKNYDGNFKINWDFQENFVGFNPHLQNAQWNLFVKDSVGSIKSYYRYRPKSEAFIAFMPSNKINLQKVWKKAKWQLDARVGAHQSSLISPSVFLHDLSMDFKVDFAYNISKTSKLGIRFGKESMGYNFYQIQTLESKFLSGDFRYWLDLNADLNVDASELGGVYDNTRKISHDNSLAMTRVWNLEIPFVHHTNNLGRKHTFSFLPQLRSFRRTWRVEYDGKPTDFGHIDEEGIFHLTKNPKYRVAENKNSLHERFGAKGWIFNQPFYAGANAKYTFENSKILMSISLSTYLAMGVGAQGNGVFANSTGIISQTTANPNNLIESFGRTHADRSIIVRYNFMKKVNENFKWGFTIKYKDGESFSTFLTQEGTNTGGSEFIIHNEGHPGDTPFANAMDKREDAYYSIDGRLNYGFKLAGHPFQLTLTAYNIFDLGLEITEYTFRPFTESYIYGGYDNNSRAALEIQTPRTIELGVRYFF
ncbi:MAG: hypothetical protein N4A45_06995 [Flavobacteriales bacterium]|jgi:hypothetical protein|nr:hypothetical protein [Flavobacteriales bacterium]